MKSMFFLLIITTTLIIACGSSDNSESLEVITPSEQIFSLEDFTSVGYKKIEHMTSQNSLEQMVLGLDSGKIMANQMILKFVSILHTKMLFQWEKNWLLKYQVMMV